MDQTIFDKYKVYAQSHVILNNFISKSDKNTN